MKKLLKSSSLFLFLIVFLSACLFRLTNLDLIEFKTDEAINLILASRPIFGHPFAPGSTVSSVGILNPPLLNYIIFPLTVISTDPRFIVFFIALANCTAIALFSLIIKKYHNTTLGIITGLLMAFSPWSILYSRKIWAQDFILPLLIPLIFSVYKITVDKNDKYWLPYVLLSLFLIQLHQPSLFFVFLLTLFLFLKRPKINFRYFMAGVTIGLLPLLPYIFYQLNNDCPDCVAILGSNQRLNQNYQTSIFLRPLQILGKGNFQTILGNDMITFLANYPLVYKLQKIFYLEYLLLPLGILAFLKTNKNLRLFAYSVLALPIFYFALKIEPLIHYFIIISPLLFLFLSFSFYNLLLRGKIIKLFGFALLSSILIYSIFFNLFFIDLLKSKKSLAGDYGITFGETWKNAKKGFEDYKKDQNYKEMVFTSFIPTNLIYGFQPIGKILYTPKEKTEKEIEAVNNLFIQRPYDPRIRNEIISFYTYPGITLNNVKALKSRTNIKGYDLIYKEIRSLYLSNNYNREFVTNLGFNLIYPQHWKESSSQNQINFSVDNYVVSLVFEDFEKNLSLKNLKKLTSENKSEKKDVELLGQSVEKTTCITQENKWCGAFYDPLNFKGHNFVFFYYIYGKASPEMNSDDFKNMEGNIIKVLKSIEVDL